MPRPHEQDIPTSRIASSDTPGRAFPVISPTMRITFQGATLYLFVAGLIGATVWVTNLTHQLSEMSTQLAELTSEFRAYVKAHP